MSATPDADWLAHLRAGGTTTWRDWRRVGGTAPARPQAAELEVVRRLAGLLEPFPTALADLVLATGASGRGPVDIPVPGQDDAHGPRAVEPDDLPAGELLRVASPVLARLVDELADTVPQPPTNRRRLRRPRFVLHGAVGCTDAVRRTLLAKGWREAPGKGALRLWLVRPPDAMVLEQWTAGVTSGGVVGWRQVWKHAARTGEAPWSVGALVDSLAPAKSGETRGHVVVADAAADVVRLALRLAGVRRGAAPTAPTPAAVEARRRLNRARHRRPSPAALFGGAMQASERDEVALGVPPVATAYAADLAADLTGRVAGLGDDYAVHGDPQVLRRRPSAPAEPDLDEALDLTLRAIASNYRRADEGRH